MIGASAEICGGMSQRVHTWAGYALQQPSPEGHLLQNCYEDVSLSRHSRMWHADALHVPCLQYCYEGVGMILPIESSMKERERFGLVLSGTIALITAIFLGFGAVSTLAANAGLLVQASQAHRTVPMLPTHTSLCDKGYMPHMQPSQWVLER